MYIQLIGAVLLLIVKIVDRWLDKDKARRKLKKEIHREIKAAIRKRDTSSITAGFNRLHKL